MMKKMLGLLFVGVAAVFGYGCGGGDGDLPEVQVKDPAADPELQEALRKEAAGEQLSKKEQAVIDNARDAGAID